MRALTSACCYRNRQISLLISLYLPIIPSPNIPCHLIIVLFAISTWSVCFKLHHGSAGSLQQNTESSSSSYGLIFHLQLLPTPPHSDAVTFSYGVMACSDTDFHRVDKAPSQAHGSRLGGRGDGTFWSYCSCLFSVYSGQ